MKKLLFAVLLSLALLGVPDRAYALPMPTVQELLSMCEGEKGQNRESFCLGLIQGVYTGLSYHKSVCGPYSVGTQQSKCSPTGQKQILNTGEGALKMTLFLPY